MTDSVLIALIIQIFGILGMFGKSWIDKRQAAKEFTNRDKLQNMAVKEVQDTLVKQGMIVNEIKTILTEHVQKDDFVIKFKNDLLKKNNEVIAIAAAYNLPLFHQNIIMGWANLLEKYALLFYHSDDRKIGGKRLENFLNNEYIKAKNIFDKYIPFEVKKAKSSFNKRIEFVDFLNGFGIYKGMDFIIQRLVKNGLTHQDIIDMFCQYLGEFSTKYLECLKDWDKLQEFELTDRFD